MKENNGHKIVFALLMGAVYTLFGLIQLITGFSRSLGISAPETLSRFIANVLFIPPDAIGGFVLVLVGSVFIYGFAELHSGKYEGIAYVYVGILLSLIFAGIYVLAAFGNVLEVYLLKNEAFAGWSILDDLRPEIYLGAVSLVAYLQWKDHFDIEN